MFLLDEAYVSSQRVSARCKGTIYMNQPALLARPHLQIPQKKKTSKTTKMPSATEILEQFYADERAYMLQPPEEQDPSLLANTLAPNIRLYQSEDLPYGGVYEGIDEFLRWGGIMNGLFSRIDVQPTNVLEKGNDVVVISTLYVTVRKTGKELAKPFMQHVKVDKEAGTIIEFRPFYWNVQSLNEALNE